MAGKGGEKSDKKPEKSRFQEGEQVLCFHGPLIYEAKCIKTKIEGDIVEYFIHYSGWNKSWDEWVAEDRLLKINDENLQKKEELAKNQKLQKKPKRKPSVGSGGDKDENNSRSNSPKPPVFGRKNITVPSTPVIAKQIEKQSDAASSRKRKDFLVFPELEFHEYITITVHLPDDLQNLLLYDLDLISKRRKVTKLPARVTVNDITDKYVLHKMSMSDEASKYKETAYGIRDYFDAILPRKLLYTSEKAQYNKIADSKQNENIAPSSLYGAVHLVRMFVKMGHLLAHLPLDTYGTDLIEENVNDYVRYLNLNISKFVNIDDYQTASSDYGRKARG